MDLIAARRITRAALPYIHRNAYHNGRKEGTHMKWPIGTIRSIAQILESGVDDLREMGMDTLQLRLGDARLHDEETLERLPGALGDFPVMTAAVGWPGPAVWRSFREGPKTLGIIPPATRKERMDSLLRGVEIAGRLNIPLAQTHFGYIPEEPDDERYAAAVDCLRTIARHAAPLGVAFCLETGQETPVTLRRLVEDAGEDNIAINLDPANLLMYGKGNPTDAVDIFGTLIRSMHIKDGDYPTDMYHLGEEYPVGQGRVDFIAIFRKLRKLRFHGPLIIEREISGPQQIVDIRNTVSLLRRWIDELDAE
jgi:hypothetical protein